MPRKKKNQRVGPSNINQPFRIEITPRLNEESKTLIIQGKVMVDEFNLLTDAGALFIDQLLDHACEKFKQAVVASRDLGPDQLKLVSI